MLRDRRLPWRSRGLLGAFLGVVIGSPAAFAHGGIEHRIAVAERRIAEDPGNVEHHLRLADLHRVRRDYPAALAILARGAVLAPEECDTHFLRGAVLLEARRPGDARAAFDRYLASCGDAPDRRDRSAAAHLGLAAAAMELGLVQTAAEHYRRATGLAGRPEPQAFLDGARALAAGGDPDTAVAYLDEGLERLGTVPSLELYGVELELDAGRVDAARERLDRLTALSPRKQHWLVRRAEILAAAGRSAPARAAPAAALERHLDEGSDQATAWRAADLDGRAWSSGPAALGTPAVTRGPYLQRASPTGLVVRWRTGTATDSRVSFGDAPDNLSHSTSTSTLTTEHEVELSGLLPETTYFYAVGSTDEILAGADAGAFFVTPPPAGTPRPTRVWVLGDSGTANAGARAVRDAYLSFAGDRDADLWLMLGDNAYLSGTDAEYQAAVFETYPSLLRRTVLWPTLGNHDALTSDSATQTGPYYDIFTLPANGEAGGFPSGTEAYYSFDHGNLHFVVLDSHDTDRSAGGAMMGWLAADLAATAADWVIAYWHHPPYSRGSHDSDVEVPMIEMRENALPVLEAAGVDLVLCGHSHSYERSFLLDSHYGDSTSLTDAMVLDAGDGRITGTGAYRKPNGPGLHPHEGAVYVVAGNGGSTQPGPFDHPAMFLSVRSLGSLVLDVDGGVLDALSLDETGAVVDSFTIVKGDGGVQLLFSDGFESGDLARWSSHPG